MKTLSMLKEAMANPAGPANIAKGVTNHLTPVENILTNVNNLFAVHLGVVATIAEDKMSIKLTSSRFFNEEATRAIMYECIWQNQSLATYISQQGLPVMKVIPVSENMIVVYMCPGDIPTAYGYEDGQCAACTEQLGRGDIEYSQYNTIIKEEEEELEAQDKSELANLLNSRNKVKAAQQFAELVSAVVDLPDNYYFKAVRDEDGNESIALRCKYEKKRPFGQTKEYTKSVMNIYSTAEDGIWVDGYDDEINPIQQEVKDLVDQVLDFVGCTPGSDGCSFCMNIEGTEDPNEDKESKEDKEGDDKQDSKEEKDKDAADKAKEKDDASLMDNDTDSGKSENSNK